MIARVNEFARLISMPPDHGANWRLRLGEVGRIVNFGSTVADDSELVAVQFAGATVWLSPEHFEVVPNDL